MRGHPRTGARPRTQRERDPGPPVAGDLALLGVPLGVESSGIRPVGWIPMRGVSAEGQEGASRDPVATDLVVLGAGVLLFLAGVGAYFAVESGNGSGVVDWIMPGLLAWLLALLGIGLGIIMAIPRMYAYAAVLAGAGVAASMTEANPGWSLVVGGAAIAVVGTTLLVSFLRAYQAPTT